ncbi:hypothetical protein NL435_26570, partial [Klebsiella pneumoniae]|nr:hypothetical protein [Klebsiella pneumoniae]
GGLDARFVSRMRADIEKAVRSAEASIPATVDGENLRRELDKKIQAATDGLNAEIPVDPERAAEWRASLEKMRDEIEGMDPSIKAKPDLEATT